MKIFFDVNILLDFFLERSPKQDLINSIFEKLDRNQIQGYVTISVIQTSAYYLKQAKDLPICKEIIGVICEKFTLVEGDQNPILSAIQSMHTDIEDSIHYFMCLNHHMDAILTSDRDFLKLSKPYLQVITPEELIESLSK
ncbi:type II toxin-antitoxin system VapC family toxin [Algoriphagus sp. AGSA1]|uniref:type II toxin-antitoxin system VapC family toxin n=1 Tax=Algoriphagus sp. AGSA1 TaxID=2907213 RepID=UPI001F25FB1E|nr:type II toxin-antitoxin system VapC family toxin [Algoriphagus sp. AGSA1]MCE7057101.1 type II toxin-antitoxin system VapC family toxin [Algoriphagus sp. AGSA1]